ncbi:MAG TPA: thioesterase family protein [Candidatus Limnocylindrales bacterium]|nr:thioesterase family protein [Candidatus Limnocylindrales bacterium]
MSRRPEPPGGQFRFEHPIEVRFVDTDAFGHVNNAVYLSYFEAARAGYYATVSGAPFGTGAQAAERTFVIAEARISYRAAVYFGETLYVGCRFAWTSRTSFGLEYLVRADASRVAPARHVADGETVQVMFDIERNRVMRVPADLLQMFEAYEGHAIARR